MFLVLGFLLFITAFFLRDHAYDVQLYDTYFVVSWGVIFVVLGLVCWLLEAGYYWLRQTDRRPKDWLKWLHLTGTLGAIILLYVSQVDIFAASGIGRRYVTMTDPDITGTMLNLGVVAMALFGLIQCLFLVGCVMQLFRRT